MAESESLLTEKYTDLHVDAQQDEEKNRFLLQYSAFNNLSGKKVRRMVMYNYKQRREDRRPTLVQVKAIWNEVIKSLRPTNIFDDLTKTDLKLLFTRRLTNLFRTRKGRYILDTYTQKSKEPTQGAISATPKIFPEEKPSQVSIFHKDRDESAKTKAILGASFSGKTYFLVDELNKLLKHNEPDKAGRRNKIYDKIIIFTESPNSEPLQKLKKHKSVMIIAMYIPYIVRLLKQINVKSDNHFTFLVILDDVISNIRGSTFTKQILTMRNSQISTCILLQYPKLISPSQRNSIHDMYFTQLRTDDWEFILKGFIGPLVKPLFDNTSRYSVLAEMIKEYMAPKSRILHFDQVKDKITFINR